MTLAGFVGKERRVNAAEDHPGPSRARLPPDFVAAPRVAGMDPDADDVARGDRLDVHVLECFVDDDRIAPFGAGRGGEHVQPTRRDDSDAERHVARVDQMNAGRHDRLLFGPSRGS